MKNLMNWHWTRWFRLVLALLFLVQGVVMKEGMAIALGAFIGLQAALNVGCCAVGGSCAPAPRTPKSGSERITYEEIH